MNHTDNSKELAGLIHSNTLKMKREVFMIERFPEGHQNRINAIAEYTRLRSESLATLKLITDKEWRSLARFFIRTAPKAIDCNGNRIV